MHGTNWASQYRRYSLLKLPLRIFLNWRDSKYQKEECGGHLVSAPPAHTPPLVSYPDPNDLKQYRLQSYKGSGQYSFRLLFGCFRGLVHLITFSCSRLWLRLTLRCRNMILLQLRMFLLLPHIRVAFLRNWIVSFFNLCFLSPLRVGS